MPTLAWSMWYQTFTRSWDGNGERADNVPWAYPRAHRGSYTQMSFCTTGCSRGAQRWSSLTMLLGNLQSLLVWPQRLYFPMTWKPRPLLGRKDSYLGSTLCSTSSPVLQIVQQISTHSPHWRRNWGLVKWSNLLKVISQRKDKARNKTQM